MTKYNSTTARRSAGSRKQSQSKTIIYSARRTVALERIILALSDYSVDWVERMALSLEKHLPPAQADSAAADYSVVHDPPPPTFRLSLDPQEFRN